MEILRSGLRINKRYMIFGLIAYALLWGYLATFIYPYLVKLISDDSVVGRKVDGDRDSHHEWNDINKNYPHPVPSWANRIVLHNSDPWEHLPKLNSISSSSSSSSPRITDMSTSYTHLQIPKSWSYHRFHNLCYDLSKNRLLYVTPKTNSQAEREKRQKEIQALEWKGGDKRRMLKFDLYEVDMDKFINDDRVHYDRGSTWLFYSTLTPDNIFHWFESVAPLASLFAYHRELSDELDHIHVNNVCGDLSSWKLASLQSAVNVKCSPPPLPPPPPPPQLPQSSADHPVNYSTATETAAAAAAAELVVAPVSSHRCGREIDIIPCRDELQQFNNGIIIVCFNNSYWAHPQSRWHGMFLSDQDAQEYVHTTLRLFGSNITQLPWEEMTLTYLRRNKRRIVNEDEFISLLRSVHPRVRVVEFNHTVDALVQIEAMRNTQIFVAIHGSGLTNIMFMRPGTVLIEMFPYMWYKRVYNPITTRFKIHHLQWHTPQLKDAVYKGDLAYCNEKMKDKLKPEDCYSRGTGGGIPKFDKCDAQCVVNSDTIVDLNHFRPVLEDAMRKIQLHDESEET